MRSNHLLTAKTDNHMRLFEREAHIIRTAAYHSFCIYQDYCVQFKNLEDFEIPKTILTAYDRAMNQQALANFLDWQGRYNFWLQYFLDHKEIHPCK